MLNSLINAASSCHMPLASFWFRRPASTVASEIDWLYMLIFWISMVFFVIIVGGMVIFVWKYRMRPGHVEQPSTHHNNTLEVAWSIIPILIVMIIFVLGLVGFLYMSNPPKDAYEVQVIAKQWSWTFRYGRGNATVESTDLHVWKGHPFKLVQSSTDVIHSLYVPAFRIKMDCVPGRYTYQWFEVNELPDPNDACNIDNRPNPDTNKETEVGYDLFCAEYCGSGHSTMWAKVIVHNSKAEFDAWLEQAGQLFKDKEGNPVPLEKVGAILYERKGCIQCHSIDGSAKVGPSFKDDFGSVVSTNKGEVTVDENYIRESLLEPNAKIRTGYNPGMPTFQGQLKDTPEKPEIDALIAFIKSLKDK